MLPATIDNYWVVRVYSIRGLVRKVLKSRQDPLKEEKVLTQSRKDAKKHCETRQRFGLCAFARVICF